MYTILAQLQDLKSNVRGYQSGYQISKDEILDALSSIIRHFDETLDTIHANARDIDERLPKIEGKDAESSKVLDEVFDFSQELLAAIY